MNNTLKLVSPIPPSVNSYLNFKVIRKGKRQIVQAYPSQETEIYKRFFEDYVRDQIQEQNWQRPEKGKLVFVETTFYMDRKRKDPNNYLKVPFDVLKDAGVYVDDDIALPVTPRLYIDSSNPRIEIEIYESEAIGIFNNEEDYQNFLSTNCYSCNKNFEKCSVLKKALDNRITENINGRNCMKKRS